MTEQSNIEVIACSSFQSAIPVNDTRSEDEHEEEIQAIAPITLAPNTLAIEGRSDEIPDNDGVENQVVALGSKRPLPDVEPAESGEKKAKMEIMRSLKQWNCPNKPCTESRFYTIEGLRSHIVECHPERKFLCDQCPFSTTDQGKLTRHERNHITYELKCNGVEEAKKCSLCNVYFCHAAGLTIHNNMYH